MRPLLLKTTILLFVSLLLSGLSTSLSAQTSLADNNIREIGLRLPNLQSFGFVYKKQKTPKQYTRHRLAFANIALENISSSNTSFGFSIGYAVGKELREPLGEKLHFIHGVEPAFSFSFQTQNSVSRTILRPRLGYVIGFQLDISDAFYINLETIPSIRLDIALNEGNRANSYGLLAGFSSDALAVTLAYRFPMKE